MNMESGTEVAQFLFWEHINGIFVSVQTLPPPPPFQPTLTEEPTFLPPHCHYLRFEGWRYPAPLQVCPAQVGKEGGRHHLPGVPGA